MDKYAVGRIENCWCCYRDRHMFKLLKQAISTAVSFNLVVSFIGSMRHNQTGNTKKITLLDS